MIYWDFILTMVGICSFIILVLIALRFFEKGLNKKKVLVIAILPFLFYLSVGDDFPEMWLYKTYAAVAFFLLLLGLSYLWGLLVEKGKRTSQDEPRTTNG